MAEPEPSEQEWEVGWEGHERAQRLRLARLSMAEKLEWLEQAQRLADRLAATRKASKPSST